MSKNLNSEKPYMFVDRVFASKGYGTIVTGTLRNGTFHENENVIVLPGNRENKIKKIESHSKEVNEGMPSQRNGLNISGLSMEEIQRGSIVCKKNFFTASKDIIAKFELLKEKKIKNNLGIEILVGTASLKGKLILINEDDKEKKQFIVRIKFDDPWFFYPGEPFVLTNPGGYRILGGGVVLFTTYETSLKQTLKESLNVFNNFSIIEILHFQVKIKKWLNIKDIHSMYSESEKIINKLIDELSNSGQVVIKDNFIVEKSFYESAYESILTQIKDKVGLNINELTHLSKIDQEICKVIVAEIIQNEGIIEKDGRFFSGSGITEDNLPDNKKEILKTILNLGNNGLEIEKNKNDLYKKEIKELIKLGFLISLDGNIIYHKKIYDSLKEDVLKLFNEKDKITVPEAKEVVGLSRKYILPLLNRIESDGLIKRIGDFRIKA